MTKRDWIKLSLMVLFLILWTAHFIDRKRDRHKWDRFYEFLREANACTDRHEFDAARQWFKICDVEFEHITGHPFSEHKVREP